MKLEHRLRHLEAQLQRLAPAMPSLPSLPELKARWQELIRRASQGDLDARWRAERVCEIFERARHRQAEEMAAEEDIQSRLE